MNDLKEMGRKIRDKRKELGLTLDDVAKSVQVAKSTIQRYEAGKIAMPKIPVVREIAKCLGLTSKWLLGVDENDDGGDGEYTYIPVIGEVSAGPGAWAENRIEDYIIEGAMPSENEHIYLKVVGDSMYPEFHEGDYVLVECIPVVESGSFGVVVVDNENGVVKRVIYGDNFIELDSINPMYPPRIFRGEDMQRVRIFGKVKGLKRNF